MRRERKGGDGICRTNVKLLPTPLYLTFKLLYTTQPPYLYDLISLQTLCNTRSSSVVTLARPPTRSSLKLPVVLFAAHRLTSGISFLTHFVSHVLICLFLIHLFSKIISPHQGHHHHYYHLSPHHSSIPNSKLSYFSNLPSIDIWHLFGLISRIPGLHYGFFLCFSFF